MGPFNQKISVLDYNETKKEKSVTIWEKKCDNLECDNLECDNLECDNLECENLRSWTVIRILCFIYPTRFSESHFFQKEKLGILTTLS
mgnify:CR=1 FL=1